MALLCVAAGAAALWLRERARNRRLRSQLETAATELEHLQRSFSRFAPDEVIERVIAEGPTSQGEKREVTALFADLVSFTSLAERVEPSVLVRILNGYFERMSAAISEHRGHVSTFLGDGILALFGALAPNPWQSDDATDAALAMRQAMVEYNRELMAQGLPALAIGIGLHRGVGVAGLIGSQELMEFAVVGRTVNIAARVQDLTRQHDADILVTEDVKRALAPRFALRELPPASLRGVDRPVAVHAVLDVARGDAAS